MQVVRNQTIGQTLSHYYVNFSLLFVPALYMAFIFKLSFQKNNVYEVAAEIVVTFLLYLLFHVGTYKTYIKKHYADKLKLQMIISNLTFQVIVLALVQEATTIRTFGKIGWIVALVIGFISIASFIAIKIESSGKFFISAVRETFSGFYLYETLIGVATSISIIFLVCQFYLLWGTVFIFTPIVTASIMMATLDNEIVYKKKESEKKKSNKNIMHFNSYFILLFLWVVGGVSLVYQYFHTTIFGMKIGHVIMCLVGASTIIMWYIFFKSEKGGQEMEVGISNE